jgi:hypothetical protein
MKFTLIKGKNMNKDTCIKHKIIDDSNLAQCEYCSYICDWDDVPVVNDNPWCSDGKVTCCPECNQGESFSNYKTA